jgi:hypothetical protein
MVDARAVAEADEAYGGLRVLDGCALHFTREGRGRLDSVWADPIADPGTPSTPLVGRRLEVKLFVALDASFW